MTIIRVECEREDIVECAWFTYDGDYNTAVFSLGALNAFS